MYFYHKSFPWKIPVFGLISLILFSNCTSSNKTPISQTTPQDTIIYINEQEKPKLIGKNLLVLEDETQNLSISDILKPAQQAKFKSNNRIIFSTPPTNKAIWLKIHIVNTTHEDVLLELSKVFWYLDFFKVEEGQPVHLVKAGNQILNAQKVYPLNLNWIKIDKDTTLQTYYLRLKTEASFEVPLQIGTQKDLIQNKANADSIYHAFLGIVLITLGYHLFLFFSTFDKVYLYYLFYLLWGLFFVPASNNYYFHVDVFGESIRAFTAKYFLIWTAPIYLFIGLFAIQLLDLKSNNKIGYWIILLHVFVLSFALPLLKGLHLLPIYKIHQVFQPTAGSFLSFLLFYGFYLWLYKKQQNARFFALAWVWIFSSSILLILTINGILPYNFFTKNMMFFGFSLEILFFSLALGDKYNSLRKENVRILKEQNVALEQKVAERTELLVLTNENLHEKNKMITESIQYAQRIQMLLLPSIETIREVLNNNFFIFFKPRDIVSGDFYYFFKKQERIFIASADCTGHGVPGALMSMIGIEILNHTIEVQGITQPSKVLQALDEGISKALRQTETGNQDGMEIALICWNTRNHTVDFSGARSPLLLIQAQQMSVIKSSKSAIGGRITEKNKDFGSFSFSLHKDGQPLATSIFMFSDGFQDQFGGKNRKKFSSQRLIKLLFDIHEQPPAEQKEILEQILEQWKQQGNESQIDDILVFGIRLC